MNIGLIGYGRMGREIEKAAVKKGHNIVHTFDKNNKPSVDQLKDCEVAIDFSLPETAVDNLYLCLEAGTPVVIGTTGWYDKLDEVKSRFSQKNGSLLYASNCSLGVNILFRVNQMLAGLMAPYSHYEPAVTEVHHTAKKDAPSGTAISLAEGLIQNSKDQKSWQALEINEKPSLRKDQLPVFWKREGDVKGYHEVTYISEIDKICIAHEAFSREGFASGAVIAAEWLKDKEGIFTMQDLLDQLS